MTLSEYIEKREEVLDAQLEKVMEKDTINMLEVSVINAQITELEIIKVALEDGKIEGI
jgi:hypothetical protein